MNYFRVLFLILVTGWASGSRQNEKMDGILQGEVVGSTETPCLVPDIYPDLALGVFPVGAVPDSSEGRLVRRMGRLEYRAPTCTDSQTACGDVCCEADRFCCEGTASSRCCLNGWICKFGNCVANPTALGTIKLTNNPTPSTTPVSSVTPEQPISQQSSQSDTSVSTSQTEQQVSTSPTSEASRSSSQSRTTSRSRTASTTSDTGSVTSESDSPSNTQEAGSNKKGKVGAIVGGSIVGTIVLIFMGLVVLFCLRPRKGSPPAVTFARALSPPMEQPIRFPPASGTEYPTYTDENSGDMLGVVPVSVYNRSTPQNDSTSLGYEVPPWLQQRNDPRGRLFGVSTPPSPGMQAYMGLTPPSPLSSPPDYDSLEGGSPSYPSNAKAVYRPVNLQASPRASRVAGVGFNAGEGENRP